MKVYGVDISEHNGDIDIKAMKNDGVKFAIIRLSWGHFREDLQARNYIAKCSKEGVDFGFYHFSYATNDSEAREEATKFLNLASQFKGRTYPLVLDMEADGNGWKAQQGVTMQQEARTVKIWKDIFEQAGEYLMIYVSKDWYDRLRAIDRETIDGIDLWLAHWGISSPSVSTCGMWQYTSDGVVSGSSKRTDLNYAYRDYPSIIAGEKPTPSPLPIEPEGTIMDLATRALSGEFGNGADRKSALGSKYIDVQREVNHRLGAPLDVLAHEVINLNRYGTGEQRKAALGDRYDEVQTRVNEILWAQPSKKSAEQIADDIWYGAGGVDWGTGAQRIKNLDEYGGLGFGDEVQNIINKKYG